MYFQKDFQKDLQKDFPKDCQKDFQKDFQKFRILINRCPNHTKVTQPLVLLYFDGQNV